MLGLTLVLSLPAAQAMAGDLLSVYRQAKQNDPVFRSAFHEYQASKEIIRQADADMSPSVNLDLVRADTRQRIISSDNTVFASGSSTFDNDNVTLSIVQPIFNWSIFKRYEQAQAKTDSAAARFDMARQDLVLRVAELYIDVLASQDVLTFSMAEQAAVERQLELVTARKDAGKARLTDLLDVKARFASVEASRIEAEYANDDALQALDESSGGNSGILETLGDNVTLSKPYPADVDAWVRLALASNPALKSKQHELEVARKEREIQRAGHYPTLDFEARKNRRDTDGSLFGGGSNVDTREYMIKLHVPIYAAGKVKSRVREANQLYLKVKQEIEAEKRAISRQVRSAYFGVISAMSKVNALGKSVEAQSLTLESKREGYRAGLYTNLAVLDAERDLYLAKKEYTQARYDYLLNSLRLKHAAGVLTESDLVFINQRLQ